MADPSSKTATGTIGNSQSRPLLTVAQARERILDRIAALDTEPVALTEARARVLAEEVRSERDVPPFANSAMDGFAIQARDVAQASAARPVRLRVLGEIRAGAAPPAAVQPHTALRIMTGAMIPDGSDAVVRVEDTTEQDGTVEVRVPVASGTSLRGAGSDLRRGDLLATAGRVITPGLIGVLASAGRVAVQCIRRPRVLVLTIGDELREPGEALGPGQITNSNRYTLLAAIQDAGGIVVDAGVARDERGDLIDRLGAAGDTDLVVTTGGVSMGAYDLVRGLLEEREAVTFWQVALRPGKPRHAMGPRKQALISGPSNPLLAKNPTTLRPGPDVEGPGTPMHSCP